MRNVFRSENDCLIFLEEARGWVDALDAARVSILLTWIPNVSSASFSIFQELMPMPAKCELICSFVKWHAKKYINLFASLSLLCRFLVSNPGDYAWGREGLDTIVTQLLNQMDSSGPPPLASDKIQELPFIKITEEQVCE